MAVPKRKGPHVAGLKVCCLDRISAQRSGRLIPGTRLPTTWLERHTRLGQLGCSAHCACVLGCAATQLALLALLALIALRRHAEISTAALRRCPSLVDEVVDEVTRLLRVHVDCHGFALRWLARNCAHRGLTPIFVNYKIQSARPLRHIRVRPPLHRQGKRAILCPLGDPDRPHLGAAFRFPTDKLIENRKSVYFVPRSARSESAALLFRRCVNATKSRPSAAAHWRKASSSTFCRSAESCSAVPTVVTGAPRMTGTAQRIVRSVVA